MKTSGNRGEDRDSSNHQKTVSVEVCL